MKRLRIVLWVVALVVVAAAAYVAMPRNGGSGVVADRYGAGDYALVAADGAPVTEASFAGGRPSLVFFGFTHCPDVCPTTLVEMTSWFETLGAEAAGLDAYFITVDPDRDTREIVGAYAAAMGDKITGVTGERAEIDKAIEAWNVHAEKVPLEGGDYTMDHTASVFLINGRGEFEGTIAYGEPANAALDKIRRLLAA